MKKKIIKMPDFSDRPTIGFRRADGWVDASPELQEWMKKVTHVLNELWLSESRKD